MTENMETIMKKAEVGYTPGVGSTKPSVTPISNTIVPPPAPTAGTGELEQLVRELATATSAMDKTAALKRLETLATGQQKALVGQTNREFKTMQTNNPGKKQFTVNGCIFKSYTQRADYTYPDSVRALEQTVKDAKKAARDSGAALKKEASVDIDTDKCFSVSVVP
jgi:hypothetical protein